MALTDEGGSNGMIMPVAPMGYGGYGYGGFPVMGGFGNGFGGWGGDLSFVVILFLFAMMGGGFGGGWGGGFGGWGLGNEITFPWLLNGQNQINANTNSGFDHAATQNALGNLSTAVNTGFSNAEVAACNRAMDAMQTAYNNQIADLNRSFDSQTAITGGQNAIQAQLAQCCCQNQLETVQTQNVVEREAAATRAAGTANTQAILDKLCQLELDGVKSDLAASERANAALQNQLNMAAFRADNTAQTAALIADNTAQTRDLINRIAPYPQPSFIVGNPYYSGYGYGWNNGGCGCNNGFGFNG